MSLPILRRKSCRALLLSPEGEILLIRVHNPASGWRGWITPGGGMDEGETESECLRRELKEELGFELGSRSATPVWTRFHRFLWNGFQVEQQELYFLVPTERFTPSTAGLSETEVNEFSDLRWWKLGRLSSASDQFVPSRLGPLLQELTEKGPPHAPIEAGE